MDTALTWLYEREDDYRRRIGGPLWSMSDWHNEPGDIALPVATLGALKVDSIEMTRYRFLDNIHATKKQIGSFYRDRYGVTLETDDFAFCPNGTSALHLSVRSLAEEGVRRILVVTPAYFSLFGVLDLYGLAVSYVHSDLMGDSAIEFEQIAKAAKDQLVDAIFLTNPVFSTGRSLNSLLVSDLVEYARQSGKWLILDETLAGLSWRQDFQSPFLTPNLQGALQYSRSIYTWSVTKSLFINGLKHSLVFAPKRLVKKIEKAADVIIGSLTAHQIALAEQLYSQSNVDEATQCARKNIARFSATYDLCAACLDGSLLRLTSVDSGFHSIVFLPKFSPNATALAREVSSEMIREHGISTIPLAHFGFPPSCPIGFRVNLSKDPRKLHHALVALVEIINKDPYLAH